MSASGPCVALLRVDEVVKGLAQETGGTESPVVDALTDLRLYDPDDGANERAGRVILAAVAAGIAHPLDLLLVEVGDSCFSFCERKRRVSMRVDHLSQCVAALERDF